MLVARANNNDRDVHIHPSVASVLRSLFRHARANSQLRKALQTLKCADDSQSKKVIDSLLLQLAASLAICVHPAQTVSDKLPLIDTPFWFRADHAFPDGFRSSKRFPRWLPSNNVHDGGGDDAAIDCVVIGAGLSGASATYHLAGDGAIDHLRLDHRRKHHPRPRRIVVLERGPFPACEASGRNGGNFELIPENAVGDYEGLKRERLEFLRQLYGTKQDDALLRAEADREAYLVMQLALRNRCLFKGAIAREGLQCDYSPGGWLYLAQNEREEAAIEKEVQLVAQHGQRAEVWDAKRVCREFGFPASSCRFHGRFIHSDGCYHPFKYVNGLLQRALETEKVELHCSTEVTGIAPFKQQDSETKRSGRRLLPRWLVHTSRGTIAARNVIVATNAFMGRLLPEISAGIEPRQSQIMVTEHVPQRTRGRIVTSERGPVFFHQPAHGMCQEHDCAPLLFGGGDDRPLDDPDSRTCSGTVHRLLIRERDRYFPDLVGRPPSAEWIGPMAFTPDQLPVIGLLKPGLVVIGGYSGYGGSYTTAAGEAAAFMVCTGQAPCWTPASVFGPRRLLNWKSSSASNKRPPFKADFVRKRRGASGSAVWVWQRDASDCNMIHSCSFLNPNGCGRTAGAAAAPGGTAEPPVCCPHCGAGAWGQGGGGARFVNTCSSARPFTKR